MYSSKENNEPDFYFVHFKPRILIFGRQILYNIHGNIRGTPQLNDNSSDQDRTVLSFVINTKKKYHVFAPMGRFQLELIYLYFPPMVENKGKFLLLCNMQQLRILYSP